MPSWKEVTESLGPDIDTYRRSALNDVAKLTNRNVIIYYSGFLQKPGLQEAGVDFSINYGDKNGFMTTIHRLNTKQGLDLVLHTPGGGLAATESLVNYLRAKFGTDIRAIVPHMAMSCGTMIALACKSIVMGKHSSLGPIDPQLGGMPAHGIVEEYRRAKSDIVNKPKTIPFWQAILSKYPPSLIGRAEKAIRWANEIVLDWLKTGMFEGEPNASVLASQIIKELGDHSRTKAHDRNISLEKAMSLGIKIESLEQDQELQEAILTLHHATIYTLSRTPLTKIIENQDGVAFVEQFEAVS